MLNFFKNVFKKGELRRRIIFTLGMLFVFRLGAAITIPSINADALTAGATNTGILGIMNMLGGGMLALHLVPLRPVVMEHWYSTHILRLKMMIW